MADYKISQTPSQNSPSRRPAKRRSTGRTGHKLAGRSLDPELVLGGLVVVLVLVALGWAWLHFVIRKPAPAAQPNSSQQAKKPRASRQTVTQAIESGQANQLSGYFASRVRWIDGQGNRSVSAASARDLLNQALSGTGNWNWHLPPDVIAGLQTGPNGQYFGDGSVIGQADDGTIISVVVDDDGQVTTVVVVPGNGSGGSPGTSNPSTGDNSSGGSTSGSSTGSGTNDGGSSPAADSGLQTSD